MSESDKLSIPEGETNSLVIRNAVQLAEGDSIRMRRRVLPSSMVGHDEVSAMISSAELRIAAKKSDTAGRPGRRGPRVTPKE